jgi:hypothetical protein
MVIRIIIFATVLFGTVFLDRRFFISKKIIIPDIIFLSWLFGVYVILLYLEIRSRIQKEENLKKLRWSGFYFTFWVGVLWWLFLAFSGGYSWFADPIRVIGLLVGLAFGGLIFGLLGMAITQFMLIRIFKLRE